MSLGGVGHGELSGGFLGLTSLIIEYFLSVFGCKGTICDVHLSKRCCLVDLLTIDSSKMRQATLQSCERVFLPIDVNAAARDLTM